MELLNNVKIDRENTYYISNVNKNVLNSNPKELFYSPQKNHTIPTKITNSDEFALKNHDHDDTYSLKKHDHDDTYSSKDHNHDNVYSLKEHNHNNTYSLKNHNHNNVYSLKGHNHNDIYSLKEHNHDNLTTKKIDIVNDTNKWSIYPTEKQLTFNFNDDPVCYVENTINKSLNTTIVHNAPINEPLNTFQIGSPVFATGIIHYYDIDKKIYLPKKVSSDSTDCKKNGINPINCISSVKSSGSYRQYLGICVGIHESGEEIEVGDLVKRKVVVNQPTITFATHGDFYFRVNDSSQYEVGDIVLFDGNKLDDELRINTKILQSIVGKITGIINEHLLCAFKD